MKEDSPVVIIDAEVHSKEIISLQEIDKPSIAVLPTKEVHICWKEYDESGQPKPVYDGLMTHAAESWGIITTSYYGNERHTFSVHFAFEKYPTVATALNKLKQLCYGSTHPDEERNSISFKIYAEVLAGKKLNDIKKTLALSNYTEWFDLGNDFPTKIKETMVMCGNEYNKDVKDEEAADFYSKQGTVLCLGNPSIEVLDNYLCLMCSDGTLYTNLNKYHTKFLWLKTLDFLEQLASSTHTCQPLQKISCEFVEDHSLH